VGQQLRIADNHGPANGSHFFFSDGFEYDLRSDAGRVSHRYANPGPVRCGLRRILFRTIH
jgi:hypothetical protein